MKFRVLAAFGALLMLPGCVSYDDTMGFLGLGNSTADADTFPGDAPPAAIAPAVASVTTDDTWCKQIAGSDLRHAQADGFDPATQQRMATASYKQCMTMSGH